MKQTALLVVILLQYTLHAQHHSGRDRRISYGMTFSPDYSYRTLKDNGGASGGIVIEARNKYEIPKFGFTTGLALWIDVSNSIRLNTGVSFSSKGYQTKTSELFYGPPPSPNDPTRASFNHRFKYIDVPVMIDFIIRRGRINFISSAGVVLNFLARADKKLDLEYADGHKEKRIDPAGVTFKKFNFSPAISLGFEYEINKDVSLLAAPTFRYGVIKIVDQPVTEYLWNAGFNMGIKRRLN